MILSPCISRGEHSSWNDMGLFFFISCLYCAILVTTLHCSFSFVQTLKQHINFEEQNLEKFDLSVNSYNFLPIFKMVTWVNLSGHLSIATMPCSSPVKGQRYCFCYLYMLLELKLSLPLFPFLPSVYPLSIHLSVHPSSFHPYTT